MGFKIYSVENVTQFKYILSFFLDCDVVNATVHIAWISLISWSLESERFNQLSMPILCQSLQK